MKHTLTIIVAAGLSMFATSAIIALATAAPSQVDADTDAIEVTGTTALAHAGDVIHGTPSEAELVAQLDRVIESQLREIKRQLRVTAVD